MIGDHQHRMSHGRGGLARAPATPETVVLGVQVGALGPAGRLGDLAQAATQPLGGPCGSAPSGACQPTRCSPDTPAQEARWAAVGNWPVSGPISATMTSAARWSTPGMVSNSATCSAKGRSAAGSAPTAERWSRPGRRCGPGSGDQQPVLVGAEPAGQGLPQRWQLGPEPNSWPMRPAPPGHGCRPPGLPAWPGRRPR